MKKFKIPWVLSNKRVEDEGYEAAFKASQKHDKLLRKAEGNLTMARDLAETLQGYLGETHIDECFTAASIVDLIEKRINKARDLLDGHSSHWMGTAASITICSLPISISKRRVRNE